MGLMKLPLVQWIGQFESFTLVGMKNLYAFRLGLYLVALKSFTLVVVDEVFMCCDTICDLLMNLFHNSIDTEEPLCNKVENFSMKDQLLSSSSSPGVQNNGYTCNLRHQKYAVVL